MNNIEEKIQQENDEISNARLNRVKSIDITIDSLKQYITLSTVSIGALVAFFNGSGKSCNFNLFITSIILFIFCTLISMITINCFINDLHYSVTNVRKGSLRLLNILAISFFILGMIFSGIFVVSKNSDSQEKESLYFKKDNLEINASAKNKMNIEINSNSETGNSKITISN